MLEAGSIWTRGAPRSSRLAVGLLVGLTGVFLSAGCGPKTGSVAGTTSGMTGTETNSGTLQSAGAHASCLEDDGIIESTPDQAPHKRYLDEGFDRYTWVDAPNGGAIYFYAQGQVDELKLIRARNLFRFFVTDVEGSTWGEDKADVLNALADNQAVLILPNGEHAPNNEYNLPAQPLYDAETPLAGSDWFMDNEWDHRDAAFEEIFHLVHDGGIGTYMPGALPDYQADLDAEARAAIEDGRWGIPVDPGVQQWLQELAQEDSLAQEYIASVIDSYYGLWGAWDEAPGGMWGIYIAKTRSEVASLDPNGKDLLEQFLPPMLTHEVRLDPAAKGTFSLVFDPAQPYTHKTQYMTWVTATGSKNLNLMGNDSDNTLRGNAGDNTLDGSGGSDTVVYCQDRSAYTLEAVDGEHRIQGPDGTDLLVNIEWVHFNDGVQEL